MNETFKYSLMKRWTVTDDMLVIGSNEIQFKQIRSIQCEAPGGACGSVRCYLMGSDNVHFLYYKVSDFKRAQKAVDYINENLTGKKVVENYRKKCKVCGFVFCYTRDEVLQNDALIDKVAFAQLGAATHTLFTGFGAKAIQDKMEAQAMESMIRDFSKCPKCNSTELIDVSEKEIQTENSVDSAVEALKKYKDLLDLGIITQEEFDETKKKLLDL